MVAGKKHKKTKRQLTEEAIEAALNGKWQESIALNDAILERFPREAEAMNRKGRAHIELRDLVAAREAYNDALKADPANMIARRNLQRLETLYNHSGDESGNSNISVSAIPRANVFIEEIGKTYVDELANPADVGELAEIAPGSLLKIELENRRLIVLSQDNVRLGEVEDHIATRMIALIEGGNIYEAYALGISGHSLRVIFREVHKDPSQGARLSFPPQARQTQELMRERELLFQREQGDFDFGDEDEDELTGGEVDIEANEEEDDDVGLDATPDAYVDSSTSRDDDEEDEM
jgi:hypothetical protein